MKQLKDLIDTRTVTYDVLSKKIGTTKQTLFNIKNDKGTPSVSTSRSIIKTIFKKRGLIPVFL